MTEFFTNLHEKWGAFIDKGIEHERNGALDPVQLVLWVTAVIMAISFAIMRLR